MSNFVTVNNGKTIINLEQVAYIEDVTAWAMNEDGSPAQRRIFVTFAAVARSAFADSDPDPLVLVLSDDEAERFLTAVMRQTATW